MNWIFSAAATTTLIVSSCSYTPSSITERVNVPEAWPAGILNLLIKSIFLKLPLLILWVKNRPDEFTINWVGLWIFASLTIPSTVPAPLLESTKVYKSPSDVYLYILCWSLSEKYILSDESIVKSPEPQGMFDTTVVTLSPDRSTFLSFPYCLTQRFPLESISIPWGPSNLAWARVPSL